MQNTRADVKIPSGYRRVTKGSVHIGDYYLDSIAMRWKAATVATFVGVGIKGLHCVIRKLPDMRGPYGRFD
jgi:hypothetical protein